MRARLFVFLQYVLPQFWLTALVYRLARIRTPAIKNLLITRFISIYDVEIDDVELDIPAGFETFNDFFIRKLEDDARPIDANPGSVVSPVDGTVSRSGRMLAGSIMQAKGIDYTLEDLLATDLEQAAALADGSFATIYLAPYNYHRVHAPFDGKLVAARYVPGDLFSVNAATAANVPGLFRRNERLILHIETSQGPAACILVGALNVGSISTPWSGQIRPRKSGMVETIDLSNGPDTINKGDLLGWFNMGSTVIILMPEHACEWHDDLEPGRTVRMGESIGKMPDIDV
jgi:phosphatidylserine decarboxylase